MNNRKNTHLLILFFLVITGIWVAPGILNLDSFLFHPNAAFSDVPISHWPNWNFIRAALRTWGEFPLWNPLILSGAPLVADPLFGVWYLPNWLSVILPVEVAFNILFWLHLAWAGLGMYKWMKSEGIHWGGALIAGIAFSGMPKLVGHVGLGHLGLVSSVAWTPWLLLTTRHLVNSLDSPGRQSTAWFALEGAVAGIIFFADPRWIFPAVMLAIFYAIRIIFSSGQGQRVFSLKGATSIIVGFLIFAGTICGLAIPMGEFVLRSTRVDLTPEEVSQLSMPINNLVNIVVPQYRGWPETMAFGGIIVLGLALIALLSRVRGWLFWFGITLGSILVALGDQTPIYPILLRIIPGFSVLRVPARFIFMTFFAITCLAGLGLNAFLRNDIKQENRRWIRLGLFGLSGMYLLLSVGSLFIIHDPGDRSSVPWGHMSIGAILLLVLAFYSMKGEVRKKRLVAFWVIAIFFDLFLINRSLLEVRSNEEIFEERSNIAAQLSTGETFERIFSPSYSVPQHLSAVEKLQLADGVNPLQLKNYWEYMAQAVGFDPEGYSVTLPPFPDGDPAITLYEEINTTDLGMLNVGTIVSEYPLISEGLEKLETVEGSIIYRNDDVRPRAWIESGSDGDGQDWQEVTSFEWSPNTILITTDMGGLLVLSELDYPGWEAYVNGDKVSIEPYQELFRSVRLEQGENHVVFRYRPWTVFIGAGVTFLSLVILGFLWWRR